MLFQFRQKSYSDAQVVEAFRGKVERVERYWYSKCRWQFGKGTSNYGGLTDYVREDLFQEAFILLWEQMERGQIYVLDGEVRVKGRSADHAVPDLMGYFMRIVRIKYLELLRLTHSIVILNEGVTPDDDDDEGATDDPYWDDDPEAMKDAIVSRCLLSLPKSCLEILSMFFYEHMSLEQILEARPENNSYDGLKTRKSKCMSNLKSRILDEFGKAGLI